jgi:hypothetical protein
MQTASGGTFWPLDPEPDDIDPADIAHALAMVCRFGGHTSRFYSVAEHSFLISERVPTPLALWGLLHDAAEAYVGDMVRPLKYQLPDYRAVEAAIMDAVCYRFGLEPGCPPEVKAADVRMLATERLVLMAYPELPWTSLENVEPFRPSIIRCWDPVTVRGVFLARLDELTR